VSGESLYRAPGASGNPAAALYHASRDAHANSMMAGARHGDTGGVFRPAAMPRVGAPVPSSRFPARRVMSVSR